MAPSTQAIKAVNFAMNTLKIGSFKVERKYAADLVAKCYYGRQKLVWEILHNGLMDKIEIQWQNISAIRAIIRQNSPGILEIEVDKVPSFYHEIEPKPGMRSSRTSWKESEDFTQGQASQYRRHYLEFPPGVLDQHYAKLLECDNRLLELSKKPFPSSYSAYFDSQLNQGTTNYSFGHVHGSKITSASEQHHSLIAPKKIQPLRPLPAIANICSMLPTLGIFPPTDQSINNQMLQEKMRNFWSKCLHDDTSSAMEYESYASCLQGSERHMEVRIQSDSPNVDQSMQKCLFHYANTSTQVGWPHVDYYSWKVPANGLEKQFCSSNPSSLNLMDEEDQLLADGLEQQFCASNPSSLNPMDEDDQVPANGLKQFYASNPSSSNLMDEEDQVLPANGLNPMDEDDQVPANGLEQQFCSSNPSSLNLMDEEDQLLADGLEQQFCASNPSSWNPMDEDNQVPANGLEQFYASNPSSSNLMDEEDQVLPANGLNPMDEDDQVPANGLEQFYASNPSSSNLMDEEDQVLADGLEQQFCASNPSSLNPMDEDDQVPANGLKQFYASNPSSSNLMDEEDQVLVDGLEQQFCPSNSLNPMDEDQVPADGLEQFYASNPSSLNLMDERCMFYIDELIST